MPKLSQIPKGKNSNASDLWLDYIKFKPNKLKEKKNPVLSNSTLGNTDLFTKSFYGGLGWRAYSLLSG